MQNKLSLVFLSVLILLLCQSSCMTTTQKGAVVGTGTGAALGAGIGAILDNPAMGAAIGAGVGAVGGALVGDSIDRKREEREKAKIQRGLELEGGGQGNAIIPKNKAPQQSGKKVYYDLDKYVNAKREDEHFFTRHWLTDHWVYTPTNNEDETELFRRIKDENGKWIFMPLDKTEFEDKKDRSTHPKSTSSSSLQEHELPLSEKEKAREELEMELDAIRKGKH